MTSSTSGPKGSTLAALMHFLVAIGSVISIFSADIGLMLVAVVLWYVLPAIIWLISSSEFIRQHARNVLWFVFVITLFTVVVMVVAVWFLHKSNNFAFYNDFVFLLENESFLVGIIWVCTTIHNSQTEEMAWLWVAIPAGVYSLYIVFAPLMGAYKAARGWRSQYFEGGVW